MRKVLPNSDAEILDDLIESHDGDLPPEAAQTFLRWKFSRTAQGRIRALLRKNNAGTIRANEKTALDRYLRIGQLLDLLHAKSELSLARTKHKR